MYIYVIFFMVGFNCTLVTVTFIFKFCRSLKRNPKIQPGKIRPHVVSNVTPVIPFESVNKSTFEGTGTITRTGTKNEDTFYESSSKINVSRISNFYQNDEMPRGHDK